MHYGQHPFRLSLAHVLLSRGVKATNGQLTEKAVSIIEQLGARVATPDETRAMLGLRRAA